MLDQNRWNLLVRNLTGNSPRDDAYSRIAEAYSEPHRHYHNYSHIEHCLREFDGAVSLCGSPDEVEFAIWLHDAVYDPHAPDNEERSALLAGEILSGLGCPETKSETIRRLILITGHLQEPATPDERLIVDIDLAILGQPLERYEVYEKGIREEYSWVPLEAYRVGRSNVLRFFLARPSIYYTERFERLYGDQARENLAEALVAL